MTTLPLPACLAPCTYAPLPGSGSYGQLGNNENATQYSPVPVTGTIRFSGITAGAYHTCGIQYATGAAFCFGGWIPECRGAAG